jgi:hypothetical protein
VPSASDFELLGRASPTTKHHCHMDREVSMNEVVPDTLQKFPLWRFSRISKPGPRSFGEITLVREVLQVGLAADQWG